MEGLFMAPTYRELMHNIITQYSGRATADIDEMFYGNAPDKRRNRLRYAIFVARKHHLPEAKVLESFANKNFPLLLDRMKEDLEEPEDDEDDEDEKDEGLNREQPRNMNTQTSKPGVGPGEWKVVGRKWVWFPR
jgi:hypothetical protein